MSDTNEIANQMVENIAENNANRDEVDERAFQRDMQAAASQKVPGPNGDGNNEEEPERKTMSRFAHRKRLF